MTAIAPQKTIRKPKIVVGAPDHERLTALAVAMQDRMPEVSDELQAEMDRAKVVAAGSVPADVVRMGSFVTFESDAAPARRVQLVFPGEADIAADRISVLTPIGAALIGLAAAQSIAWTARDGRRHVLTVLSVEQPSAEAAQPDRR